VVQASNLAHRNPRTLSGGETARVGLARAFVVRPKLLLMDEPFSALDVESKMHVLRNMREWLHLAQTTAILVSHDYAEVSYLADRLIVMSEGKIVADGKPGEVLDRVDIAFVRDFAALGGGKRGVRSQ
ncbi:MAG: ATP-binding cassette domain-containing protein, partial [Peptococcaceae bacterium]|nr:ATP-binding cassette domain-containing protein [Peptococcaceae bacterium]